MSKRLRRGRVQAPIPVWPYFFLSIVAVVIGVVFIHAWWPTGYPGKSELVKLGGEVDTIIIKDDISKTSAGAMMPALTSVYFTLEGVEGEFRYPSTHPRYRDVRDYTAVGIEVWVDRAELGTGRPVTIWQIEEHNPYKLPSEQTFVAYAEIVDRLTAIDRSMVKAGGGLLVLAAVFLVLALVVRRWNRSRALPRA